MAGYSGTPLPQKLGIKDDHRVAVLHGPKDFASTLGRLPPGATVATALRGAPFNVIVLFLDSVRSLIDEFEKAAAHLDESGGFWIAWPKKASGIKTDLTENIIREVGLAAGLVDNKVCAIDEVWSGLRFVVRLRDRSKKGR